MPLCAPLVLLFDAQNVVSVCVLVRKQQVCHLRNKQFIALSTFGQWIPISPTRLRSSSATEETRTHKYIKFLRLDPLPIHSPRVSRLFAFWEYICAAICMLVVLGITGCGPSQVEILEKQVNDLQKQLVQLRKAHATVSVRLKTMIPSCSTPRSTRHHAKQLAQRHRRVEQVRPFGYGRSANNSGI